MGLAAASFVIFVARVIPSLKLAGSVSFKIEVALR
jgi:hypothetical protein